MKNAIWDEFCRGLKPAGDAALTIIGNGDKNDLADGNAQLAGLLEAALRWHCRSGDPDFPNFVEINDTPELADNMFAPIRGDASYKLTGNISTLFDLNISIHTNWAWIAPSQVFGDLGRKDLTIDKGGNFELILSAQAHDGDWLALPADAAYIQVREYHADYTSNRPGSYQIVRIGADGTAPPRRTNATISEHLQQSVIWAQNYVDYHFRAQSRLFPETGNTLSQPAPQKGGNKNIHYGFGRFRLDPDEALIVEFEEPDARLWGIQWLLAPWYENPDFLNHMTSLPSGEAFVNSDGRVRVVIAARDPGTPNWLDIAGYTHGLFVIRWLWRQRSSLVELSTAPITEIRSHLPEGTPHIGSNERNVQLSRRRAHFACRRR